MNPRKLISISAALAVIALTAWIINSKLEPPTADEAAERSRKEIAALCAEAREKNARLNSRIKALGSEFEDVSASTNWKLDTTKLTGTVPTEGDRDRLLTEFADELSEVEIAESRKDISVSRGGALP